LRYRIASIHPYEDYGPFGTKTKNIDISDVISRIRIIAYFINGSASQAEHPAANIAKVELVDGSDVLYSLTGKCAQIVDWFDRPRLIYNAPSATIGYAQQAIIDMNFGRYLWDPLLAFDPKKFTNPQLKITWNEAVANTLCTINGFRIDAWIFDEYKPVPTGFLMNKEIFSYAPAANAYEYVDLPCDYPYRRLMLQALAAGIDVGGLVSEFKLSEDTDKKIPFDTTFSEEFNKQIMDYGYVTEQFFTMSAAAGQVLNVMPGAPEHAFCVDQQDTGPAVHFYAITMGNGGRITIISSAGGNVVKGRVWGYCPHGAFGWDFGQPSLIEDWYDVTKIGDLKFRVKAGASALSTHTFRVLLQQHRKY